MKVSIAMATYNGAKYIQEQLQSFIDQTRQPDELIITDDCSTDLTEVIVRNFAKTAPFCVKFYRNEKNLGYCGNFNAALSKTTGDLVFLSDQDDVWFAKKIEHMIGVAEHNPKALVMMNDAALTDGELNEVGLTKIGQIQSAGISMKTYVMGCCCAVRRELLDLCLPIPRGFDSHDAWLVWFADGLEAKIIESTTLQYYRRHDSNESNFLANRLSRVTRLDAFTATVKGVFENRLKTNKKSEIEKMELFCSGLRRAVGRSDVKHSKAIARFLSETEHSISTLIKRYEIRQKSFLFRIFHVTLYSMRGGYARTSGIKSMLRDLFG